MILGKDLVLALNGTPLAAARSCSLDCDQSFLQTAAPTDGRWENVTPQRLGWSMSADALIGSIEAYQTLKAAWRNGTALTMRFYNTDYALNETGTVYIERIHLEGNVGSLAKMSVSLKGSGPLSTYGGTELYPTEVYSEQDAYYSNRGGSYAYISQNGATLECLTLTLAQRTWLKFAPNGNTIFWSHNSGLITAVQDHETITSSQEYDYDINELTEMWVEAGTYYILYDYPADSQTRPQIFSLS